MADRILSTVRTAIGTSGRCILGGPLMPSRDFSRGAVTNNVP